ncbi:TauD/TfdA family dioxygenase [Kutzneria sp. 744]|uniref:TauD/TfdA family dioxygenase n=1 Tax=Kutzneria sp. (strain 744) TaxID=345341 RepID=UPI0004BBD673|nr:TauD/TfdA family dioxygenase [Kutzneria sp. 744]
MLVDTNPLAAGECLLELSPVERDELDRLAATLATRSSRRTDDPGWLADARELCCMLPARLRATLRRFTSHSGAEAMLLVRGLPVAAADVPPTPSVAGSVQREASMPAAALVLLGMFMGELVAFREEKSGALVQDVVPVPGQERVQGNSGSVRLTMHVENAFHAHRPDFVGLMCLRNDHDNVAGLRVASSRKALPRLTPAHRSLLHEPRFVTAAPQSFNQGAAAETPHGVLTGAVDDPDVRVDFGNTAATDPAAAAALAELERAFDAVASTLILAPGDVAWVDNRLSLHGRTSFTPRYDGGDRWIQRVFVQLDFRRSRVVRPHDGQVITAPLVAP